MREREERDRDRFQIPCIPRKARKGSKKRLNINKEFPVTKYSRLGGIYHNQSSDIDPCGSKCCWHHQAALPTVSLSSHESNSFSVERTL